MGKVNSHTPIAHATEESDGAIVLKPLANKETAVVAELAKERALTKRNSKQKAANRIQRRALRRMDRIECVTESSLWRQYSR